MISAAHPQPPSRPAPTSARDSVSRLQDFAYPAQRGRNRGGARSNASRGTTSAQPRRGGGRRGSGRWGRGGFARGVNKRRTASGRTSNGSGVAFSEQQSAGSRPRGVGGRRGGGGGGGGGIGMMPA